MELADELLKSELNIIGNNRFRVSNFKRIIEYTDSKLTIESMGLLLSIKGENFKVRYMSQGELSVSGEISTVEFLKGKNI